MKNKYCYFIAIIVGIIISMNLVSADYSCYQEHVNITNQTGIDGGCDLNYTGSYQEVSSGVNSSYYDGNFNTYTGMTDNRYVYINYTKPYNVLNTSVWRVKDYISEYNLTITANCWNAFSGRLALMFFNSGSGGSEDCYWACFNSTMHTLIIQKSECNGAIIFYEEAMQWDIQSYPKKSYYPCYQEATNVSNQSGTDGWCRNILNYSGNYTVYPSWNNPLSTYDGDFGTAGYSTASNPAVVLANYRIPPYVNTNAFSNNTIRFGEVDFSPFTDYIFHIPFTCLNSSNTLTINYSSYQNVTGYGNTEARCMLGDGSEHLIYNGSLMLNGNFVREEGIFWDINTPWIEESQTFNSTAYEYSNENLIINIGYYSSAYSGITATLNYNGTSYSGTKVGTGDNVYFIRNLGLTPSNIGNNTFYWTIGLINSTGTFYFNSTTKYQNVSGINFGLCNATLTVPYVNFTFKDEDNATSIPARIVYSTFYYYVGNNSNYKTYTYSTASENLSYAFCVSPSNVVLNVDARIQYESTGYQQRIYNPDVISYSNATTNTTLYLLSDEDGLYVTFLVLGGGLPLEGAEVNVYRDISGVPTIVGYGTTGASGSVTMWLNPNFLHTMIISKSGYVTYSFTEAPTQTQYTIDLTAVGVSEEVTDYTFGVSEIIMPTNDFISQNTTYEFNYTIISSYYDLDEFGISLYYPNGTLIDSDISYTPTGGTLRYTLNIQNLSRIKMNYYYIVNSTYINGTRVWITENPNSFSIWNFFTDLNIYIEGNLFGILGDDNGYFGRALISFVLLVLIIGGLVMRYGIVNESVLMGMIFGVVVFLNTIGMIPTPDFVSDVSPISFGDFIVFVVLIILIGFVIREERK